MSKNKERLREWDKLVESTANAPSEGPLEVIDIEVSKVLDVGHYMVQPPEVAVVEDTQGRKWMIPETIDESRDGLDGLVSRHNVRPGMKLRLEITKIVVSRTSAYPLTPEREESRRSPKEEI